MKYKLIIIALLILSWCGVIFYTSNKTSEESNKTSKSLIYNSLKIVIKATNKVNFTHIEPKEENYSYIVDKLNYPVRKCAHMAIYLVLGILIIVFLKLLDITNLKASTITLALCFFYSLTDEYHQTFITRRNGQFRDCLIDLLGTVIGITLVLILTKYKKKDYLTK